MRAESPGLSRFAVVVGGEGTQSAETPEGNGTTGESEAASTPTPTPSPGEDGVVVTNATLSAGSVDPGTAVLVNATIENPTDEDTDYVAGLSVNGTVVATESIRLPAGERQSVSFEYAPEEPGTYPATDTFPSAPLECANRLNPEPLPARRSTPHCR